jgi:hypothetical protein
LKTIFQYLLIVTITLGLDDVLVGGDELDRRRQLTRSIGVSGLESIH